MAIMFIEATIYLVAMFAMLVLEAGRVGLSLLGVRSQAKPSVAPPSVAVQTLSETATEIPAANPIDSPQATFDFDKRVTRDEVHGDDAVSFAPPASSPLPVSPSAKKSVSFKKQFVGILMDFGVGEFTDTRSKAGDHPRKYQSFYVTVELDDGGIETKQGVELETALQQSGVAKGERIELLFLGREKIEDQEDGKSVRYRNRWRINRL